MNAVAHPDLTIAAFETAEGWLQFKRRNADLITGSKPVLSRYYTQEHLLPNRARTRFLLPDNLA